MTFKSSLRLRGGEGEAGAEGGEGGEGGEEGANHTRWYRCCERRGRDRRGFACGRSHGAGPDSPASAITSTGIGKGSMMTAATRRMGSGGRICPDVAY